MAFYTYILASRRNGTPYVGMTDDLEARVEQHRAHAFGGFTARHQVHTLVWFQVHDTRERAFERERAIKKWRRAWKLEMIETVNPSWRDLLPALVAERDAPYRPGPIPATSASLPLIPSRTKLRWRGTEREGGRAGLPPDVMQL